MSVTTNKDGSLVNAHFARVSTVGTLASPSAQRADNEDQKPLCDEHGKLWITTMGPFGPIPGYLPVAQALSGGAFVTSATITGPGQNFAFSGFNSDPANLLYVQMIDQLAAPVGGEAPDIIIPVPSLAAFSYSLPISFSFGIVIAISTTPLTFTAPAANYLSYAILYRDAV